MSVCVLVTTVDSGKTADLIEMSFGVVGSVGPKKHLLYEGSDGKGHFLWGQKRGDAL